MNLRKKLCKAIAFIITLIFCFSAFGCSQETTPTLFTVSFDYGYGDKVLTEQVEDGSLIASPDAPMRIGYEFDGWWISDGGEERLWNFEKDVVLENVTLYARWKKAVPKPFVITLDPNGGTCSTTQIEVYDNQEYSLPIPQKDGYYFIAWGYKESEKQLDVNGIYTDKSDAGLVAIWRDYPANTIIKMGKFEQDDDLSNGPEELEWQIVKHEDGKYMLISKHILTTKAWGKTKNWKDSIVCEWLNGEFYENTFSDEEKKHIYTTEIDDECDSKLFCPHESDIRDDVIEKAILCPEPTPYATSSGVKTHYSDQEDGSVTQGYAYYLIGKMATSSPLRLEDWSCSGAGGLGTGIRPVMWVSEEFVESFIK